MTRLIIVRHGYSVTNASQRFTGQTDVALTDIGRQQAESVADYLTANEHIDAIYASDLSRAVDTARPTAERLGLPIHTDPALRELAMGVFEGMLFDDVHRIYAEDMARRKVDAHHPCPGGESTADMLVRVKGAIERIAAEHAGKTVMIVTHGGALRIVNSLAEGIDLNGITTSPASQNASISTYLHENGRLKAVRFNFTGHLTDAATSRQGLQ